MYKTNNFSEASSWLKRFFFTTLLLVILFITVFDVELMTTRDLLIIIAVYILILVSGQIDELEINEREIIISQRSLIPFLRSKRTIGMNEIIWVREQEGSDGNRSILSIFDIGKSDNDLAVYAKGNRLEIIHRRLHRHGSKGIEEEIMEYWKPIEPPTFTNGKEPLFTKIIDAHKLSSTETIIQEDWRNFPEGISNIYCLDNKNQIKWYAELPMEDDIYANQIQWNSKHDMRTSEETLDWVNAYSPSNDSFVASSYGGVTATISYENGRILESEFTK